MKRITALRAPRRKIASDRMAIGEIKARAIQVAVIDRVGADGLWVRIDGERGARRAGRYPIWSNARLTRIKERGDRLLVQTTESGEVVVLGIPAILPDGPVSLEAQQIILDGKESITLRVGKASITLTADGEISFTGTRLVSRARESQRLLAPMIQLN